VLATRHLVSALPETFGAFRRVAVLETGVLGNTGMESAELVRAVAEKLRPDAVIAVDALASRRLGRVCRTVQLTDTGVAPGSGVGNARRELSLGTLGVPVVGLGVPTVVDAATLAADLTELSGLGEVSAEDFGEYGAGMMVTPREIDQQIALMARLLGYGIDLALHDLSVSDVTALVG
jgi:spore protease